MPRSCPASATPVCIASVRIALVRTAFALTPLLLGGCIARTAADIVTLPVRAASAGVDAVTTSQSEADRNRGREIRKQEERDAKARRKAERENRRD